MILYYRVLNTFIVFAVSFIIGAGNTLAQDYAYSSRTLKDQYPPETNSFLGSSQFQKKELASLSFAWSNPCNLAAFERNGKVWLIFDQLQQIDVDKLKETAGELAKSIYQFPHPLATLIQITPADGVNISIRKEGLLWIADMHTSELPPHNFKEMTIFTQYDSLKQPYLFIPSNFTGNVISIIDPEIGDIISTATTSQPDLGTLNTYRYPEFDILKTYQGMAFVINSPDIILSRGNSGLTLRAQGRGLNITSDLERIKSKQSGLKDDQSSYFNLQISQKQQRTPFPEVVEKYKKDIIAAPIDKKNKIRIDLARYYTYYGLGSNALFILNQMKRAQIPESETNGFRALSGVANFLARRYAESVDDFSYGNLPNSDEGKFWLALAKSAKQYSEQNNAIIFDHISIIKDYPQEIKDQIALIAAENAIMSGDDLSAQNFIDILRSVEDRIRNLDPQIHYLLAKKLELQGYPRNAIKEYRNIISSPSIKYSALARYHNAVLSQKIKAMPLKEAIAELERLRFAWSEQEFKIKLLDQLAELYLKDFDFHNALRTLNEAGVYTPVVEQKERIAKKMLRVFEEIFLSNQADAKLSPITALALYQDFNWLSNISSKKNTITQRLADRLVAVDLTSRAYNLLADLLLNPNVTAEDKARIGARMAIIHLFEENPFQALEILRTTDAPNLSEETTNPRRVIMARAYTQMGETQKALELLKNDYGKTALLHKFEIYWKGELWDKAAESIKYLIEEPNPNKPLSQEQINFILDWATTLKKAGKETVLIRIRNKFMPYFANTKYHSIFNILTKHLDKDKINLNEINKIVNDVQTFTNYAKIYGESLQGNEFQESK